MYNKLLFSFQFLFIFVECFVFLHDVLDIDHQELREPVRNQPPARDMRKMNLNSMSYKETPKFTHESKAINPRRDATFTQSFPQIISKMITITRNDIIALSGVLTAHFHNQHFYLSLSEASFTDFN